MDFDAPTIRGNGFTMERPPRSERQPSFPEVDRGEWFPIQVAQRKIRVVNYRCSRN
jgi:predicted NUDIX family NTP pyrophosphohydrolase